MVTKVSPNPRKYWLTIVLSILSPLLGSGLIATGLNSYISNMDKPNIQILVIPDHNNHGKMSIEMSNIGRASATHLKLTIETPEDIANYNNFTTENLTLKKINPRLLEGYLPRFVQGDGSLFRIDLMISAKPNIDYSKNYSSYATYDQGSSKGKLLMPAPDLSESLNNYVNWITPISGLWTSLVGIAAVIAPLIITIFKRIRNKQ